MSRTKEELALEIHRLLAEQSWVGDLNNHTIDDMTVNGYFDLEIVAAGLLDFLA
jgi:hypothetical protein